MRDDIIRKQSEGNFLRSELDRFRFKTKGKTTAEGIGRLCDENDSAIDSLSKVKTGLMQLSS